MILINQMTCEFFKESEELEKTSWTIETPSRLLRVGVDKIKFIERKAWQLNLPLAEKNWLAENQEIIKLICPTGVYYEGLDHSEIVLILIDFEKTYGVSGEKIVLVNVDEHNDIRSIIDYNGQFHKPKTVDIVNCIGKTAELGLCNPNAGLY